MGHKNICLCQHFSKASSHCQTARSLSLSISVWQRLQQTSWWLVSHASCQDMFFLWTVSSLPLLSPLIFFNKKQNLFFALPVLFLFHGFVYIHRGWKSQTQEDAAGVALFSPFLCVFLPPSFFFFLCWNATGCHARGFQTSVCVRRVPGEQPHHNSRVEWAGKGMRGKMNSVLWGFPKLNSLRPL